MTLTRMEMDKGDQGKTFSSVLGRSIKFDRDKLEDYY